MMGYISFLYCCVTCPERAISWYLTVFAGIDSFASRSKVSQFIRPENGLNFDGVVITDDVVDMKAPFQF